MVIFVSGARGDGVHVPGFFMYAIDFGTGVCSIHGGRKECPDVGFQRRGAGKEACALLAKLVT